MPSPDPFPPSTLTWGCRSTPSTRGPNAGRRCRPSLRTPRPRPRKKRALRKARKAAAAVARLNKRRAEKLGKEPASRKGTAASGRANFSRNLSRKLALNLSKLPAPAARVQRAAAQARDLVGGAWVAASHGVRASRRGPGASSWVAAGVEGAVRGAGFGTPSGVALCLLVCWLLFLETSLGTASLIKQAAQEPTVVDQISGGKVPESRRVARGGSGADTTS